MIRLVLERRRRGWSQRELARRAGVHETSVCLVESGRYRPGERQLEKISTALGIGAEAAHLLLEPVPYEPLPAVVEATGR